MTRFWRIIAVLMTALVPVLAGCSATASGPGNARAEGVPAATATIPAATPTTPPAPAATPANKFPLTVSCMPSDQVIKILNDAKSAAGGIQGRIGFAITAFDAAFDNDPSIGYRSNNPGSVTIDNPGQLAIFYSNVSSPEFFPQILNGGKPSENVIPITGYWQGDGQHGWGLARVYTAIKPNTAFTAVRVCGGINFDP